ncbi:MBOAT family O-acyltransferase [Candidatus Magnetominusculus dajiuhuensis]|uniref:MBOAT family O-acyltransferase n=1 Tax=Candidatus Magnetominusculus dajiuhuensis TaxID=3137712 RepID=UPI003B42F091
MNITSLTFALFCLTVFFVRIIIGRYTTIYIYALIIFSVSFYAWDVPAYVLILLISIVVHYYSGIALTHFTHIWLRKAILTLSICFSIGLLCYYKYLLFLIDNINRIFNSQIPITSHLLPIGISFYTFHLISYSTDIYRRSYNKQKNFTYFLLYNVFFPHMVAGPIVRADEFMNQISTNSSLHSIKLSTTLEGLYLIIRGLFFKLVVANHLSVFVNDNWQAASGSKGSLFMSISVLFFFSGQIYSDFAGYSDIARGLAYVLGFYFPVNFKAPYIAATFSEFWRRWHITLSKWIRDYLYISIGGSRKGYHRTYINLLIVMLLCGLWHGASFTFVAWGGLHGALLCLERLFGMKYKSKRYKLFWYIFVQCCILLSWAFFRSRNISEAFGIIINLINVDRSFTSSNLLVGFLFLLPIIGIHVHTYLMDNFVISPSITKKSVYAIAMCYAILTFYGTNNEFIYFRF